MNNIQELMELLKPYILNYAEEFGVIPNNSGFITCLNPEHEDHNPSMHFWEENNIFYCFSCNYTCDIFDLAHLLENKPICGPDFIEENVFYLARKYGFPYEHLQKELTAEEIKKHTMYRIMKSFSDYITKNANKDFLTKRNITEETAKELNIGSVVNFEDCKKYLLNNFKLNNIEEILKEIGITKFKVNENKLIFIIKDKFGRPCSFVSREMNDIANNPKYINGAETEIYNKSEIFFGWSDIKKKFNPLGILLIVEGYIDFVTAYQKGFRNVVALGSASFTDEHIAFLEKNKNINKIAIALDNDKTGNKRTDSLIERFKNKKLNKDYVVAINKMSQYKDLDEILNNSEDDLTLIDIYDIYNLFEYELKKLKEGPFEESIIFDKFVSIIAQSKSPKLREEQARILSKYLNEYSYKTILEQIEYTLESKNELYKQEVKKLIDYASKNVERNPDNLLTIIEAIKEDYEDINKKFEKKKTDIFESGLEFFDEFERNKSIYDLFNIDFQIPWLDDLDLIPGNTFGIASNANSGKTTLLQQIAINVASKVSNGFVLYISTDDPAEKIYSNLIANLTGLPRDYCSNPNFHYSFGRSKNTEQSIKFYEKYEKGKNYIKRLIETKRLLILDVKHGIDNWIKFESCVRDIGTKDELKEKFKIMIIDSANKISTDIKIQDSIGFVSENIKKLSEKYKYLSFVNYELNKSKNNAKHSQYNLSGSRRMNYDCDVVGFIYNPTRNLQNIHNTQMIWNNNGKNSPVLITLQEKSKAGNNQNNNVPYFYKLDEITSKLIPVIPGSQEYNYYFKIWGTEFEQYYE